MKRKLILALCLFILPLAFSCKDKQGGQKGGIIAEYPLEGKPGFTLKLLSQGDKPHKELKFKFKKGSEETRKMVMRMNMQMTTGGNKAPVVKSPPVITPVSSVVKEVDENGTARVSYEIKNMTVGDDPEVNPQMIQSMRERYSQIGGISCTGKVSATGIYSDPECELGGDIAPYNKQYLDEMMKNFSNNLFIPHEPVGVGAEWETVNPSMISGGIKVDFNAKYRLVSLDGDKAVIESTISQKADEQMVKFPGTAFETKIESLNSTGSAKMEVNFNEFLPRGSIKADTEVVSAMQLQNTEENKVVTDMDISIEITD